MSAELDANLKDRGYRSFPGPSANNAATHLWQRKVEGTELFINVWEYAPTGSLTEPVYELELTGARPDGLWMQGRIYPLDADRLLTDLNRLQAELEEAARRASSP